MYQRSKIAIAVAVALNSMSAYAQVSADTSTSTTAAAPQRVEITGSRIRQVDLETSQPVTKITAEQIQATGVVTVGDLLNQMTTSGTPAFSKGSVLTSNREQGGQYLDMRNLGAKRLLVLVNGKRWTQSVDGYTDMSTVPSSMIDHVDILKDGASAIYGSDAIAGVVNIVLKKSMEGGQVSVYSGRNEKGDGQARDLSLSYGASNEVGSLMFGLTHTQTEPVWAKDREITATTYGPNHLNSGFGTSPWGRIRNVSATGAASGMNQILKHTGSYNGDGVGQSSRNPANYQAYTGADADTFNSSSQMMFQSGSKLDSMFTKGELNLPWGLHFASTAMLAERTSSRQIAGYPLNSLTQSKYPVYIDKDSYYNPYGNQVAGAGKGVDLFFYRRTIEVPRVTENKNQTVHVDATLDGAFNIKGSEWTWDVGFNHSAITGTTLSTGNLNLLNLKKAVGPSFLNANGVVQCGTAASPIPLAECTPWDILGGPSASNSAALAYVMSTGQSTYGSTVNSWTANLSGSVLKLPAGDVGVAGGLEHRKVSGYDRPGQFEQSGYSTDLAGNATFGAYTVKEAYLEANIPVLKDKPFAKMLSLDFASRYSDYSNFGSTTNNKASFQWKPHNDALFRGTYAEGFRAPTVGDTFGGGSQSYDSYLDPCDSAWGEAAKNATVKARCTAAGVPVTFRQVNQAGTAVPAGGAQSPTPFNTGAGNDSLTPETAKTRTLGLVYNPSFLPGASVALDWYKIQVDNRITAVSATYVINQCVVQGVQSFCDKFKRDPLTGQIVTLSRGNANLGQLSTEGVDLALNYRFAKSKYGQFALRSENSYVASYKIKSTATSDWVGYAGEYGIYRLKSNVSLDWKQGNWSSTFTSRYYSSVKGNCWSSTVECSNPNDTASWGTGYNKVGAVVYSDLSVGYKTPWKGQIVVGSNNIFNRKPRVVLDAGSAYGGPSSSSSVNPDLPIDRFFYARYNQSF
ncbi:TonB-dependent receptor plug domain-containing protein [Oxalobacteraceae bacterium A2-2]